MLEDNREQLTRVAEYLLRNETIDGDTFRKLYNGEDVPDRVAPSEEELKGEAKAPLTKPADEAQPRTAGFSYDVGGAHCRAEGRGAAPGG